MCIRDSLRVHCPFSEDSFLYVVFSFVSAACGFSSWLLRHNGFFFKQWTVRFIVNFFGVLWTPGLSVSFHQIQFTSFLEKAMFSVTWHKNVTLYSSDTYSDLTSSQTRVYVQSGIFKNMSKQRVEKGMHKKGHGGELGDSSDFNP